MLPRIASLRASLAGASRAALTAALLLHQRLLWTAALASPLALQLRAWSLNPLEHAVPMSKLRSSILQLLARLVPTVAWVHTTCSQVISTMTNSTSASIASLRTSLAGASRAALTAALLLHQRLLWTAALASLLALQLHAWSLSLCKLVFASFFGK